MPKEGDPALEIQLPDQEGQTHSLSQYRGKWVLLYFYPKDDTPGCTKEACAIRDAMPQISATNLVVLGVSTDSVASHKKFVEKYGLLFTLLADEQKEVVRAYGVWGEKKMMGRSYEGVRRTSFLINPDGYIARVYENVKPEVHAQEVLADLANYQR